jgi:cytochrome b561
MIRNPIPLDSVSFLVALRLPMLRSSPGVRSSSVTDEAHYDPTTIVLHWATVFLILVLWVIGMTADWLARGPVRSAVWSLHVLLGCATAFVLVTRIALRAHFGRTIPPAETGILHAIAKATHYTLYILLAAVVVTGIANAS